MANTLTEVTPKLLAQGLLALREQAIMPRLVNRAYETIAGQRGSTIDVPIPSSITIQTVSPSHTPPSTSDVAPTSVALALDQWKEAPFYLTDKDMLTCMEGTIPMQASEAVKAVANNVDAYILGLYTGFYGWQGTAGTTPFGTDTSDATGVRKVLNNQLAPLDDRHVIFDPDAEANALNLRAFQDASFSGDLGVITEGQLNRKLGFSWWMDQNIPSHTLGVAGTVLVDQTDVGVGDVAAHMDGLTAVFSVGDIFTVAGDSQTYVIVTCSVLAGTDADITFQPAAKVAWADDAAVTPKATHVVNLAIHRDAIAFATRPLEQEGNGLGSIIQSAVDPVSGLTLRLEISREHKRTRFSYDILYGAKVVRAALGARLAG